jgi:hypothetical protein
MKGVRIQGRFVIPLVGLVTLTFGLHGKDGGNGQPLIKPNIQKVGLVWDYFLARSKFL